MKRCVWVPLTLVLCALAGTAIPAAAAPSALIVIPTADVVDKHNVVVDMIFFYDPTAPIDVNSLVAENEFGLGGGWETGFDFVPNAPAAGFFNIKKQLNTSDRTQWAFGAYNIPIDVVNNYNAIIPYAVTTTTTKSETTRFHVGAQWAGEAELFIGMDHQLSNDFQLWMDWTTGLNGLVSIGLDYAASNNANITAGLVRNHAGGWGVWTDWVYAFDWD